MLPKRNTKLKKPISNLPFSIFATFASMPFQIEKISLLQTGLLSPLMCDYLFETEKVKSLYSFAAKEEYVPNFIEQKKAQKINRTELNKVLMQQFEKRKFSPSTQLNIESLKQENTFSITCAHQPTLLFHPAFFFHKIASTIALAKQFNERFSDYHFVPVFWLGSEDHDFEELGNAFLANKKIEWQTEQKGAVGRFLLNDNFKQILADFKLAYPALNIHSLCDDALKHTSNFGEFTAFVVQAFFSEYGLVVLNQDDALLKKLFAPVIEDEVLHSRAEKVLQPTIEFLESNYKTQATVRPINFFYIGNNYRERMVRVGENNIEVLHQSISFSEASIKKEIAEKPENFSPNVMFRPLFQETVLPNVAFVGGGAECSYWLQQKALFDYYQVAFPMVVHRTPVVVVPQSISRKAEKLQLSTAQIFNREDVLIKNYLSENFGEEISLAQATQNIEAVFTQIEQKIAAVDATLTASVKAEKQKTIAAVAQLEGKALKALKRKSETVVEQLKSIYQCYFVDGKLQERKVNFFDLPDEKNLLEAIIASSKPLENELLVLKNFNQASA